MFVKFDGFGRLAEDTAEQVTENPDRTWSYTDPDTRQFEYDALGRRVVERHLGQNANERFSLYLFTDAAGNVLEERRRQLDAPAAATRDQYVWSAAGAGLLVLQDADDPTLTFNGDWGLAGSGLERRLWVEQGPDGSVWEVWPQGGTRQESESYLYTPEGDLTVLDGDGVANGGGTYRHSKYDWRYFWRGGRAEHYAFDDGTATHYRYDGLLLMPGGGEHDVVRGAPLAEDAHAYHRTTAKHVEWTAVQAGYAGAGTGSWWSKPQAGGWGTAASGLIGEMSGADWGHLALDLGGMIPVAGAVFDLANAGWYAYEGDYENAIWSGAAAIPGIGDAAMAIKWGKRGVEAAGAGYKLARAATRGADIGVNFAQGGSAVYQGYQSGNYLQMGVGALGIGMNAAFVGRHAGDIGAFFAEHPRLNVLNYRLQVDNSVLGTAGAGIGARYQGPSVNPRHYSTSEHGIRLHNEAKAYRSAIPAGKDGYRNIAVADVVVNGKSRTARFLNTPGGMHSEQRLVAWETAMRRRGRTIEVQRVYSERIPCPPSQAGCRELLGIRYGSDLETFFSQGRGRVE